MARHKMVNGNKVFFTQAEENERDAREAQWLSNNQARIDAEAVSVAKKESGKQKLKDLGLDDDEIKELTGA